MQEEQPTNEIKQPISIDQEMRTSYLDYAMSVIVGRALPDVRDGLKPVQRRILYAMFREGLLSHKKYSKCAGVVGEVLKKYHPHGDSAVYDALVRMAQDFNMRYRLVDGQGNFGSIDGDPPAAYRYTEARLQKLAEEMLADIDKETVPFGPNFDEQTEEPLVLPTRVPELLINGSSGIAVGMATNIPPHNLGEVVDGLIMMIENPEVTIQELMGVIKGPDFPTAGVIHGTRGIVDAYMHGRGLVRVRGRADIETAEHGNRETIIINDLPYQVNKAKLVEKIAELMKEKRIEGISDLRDESNKQGIRIVIELKRGEMGQVVLNQLYQHTALQSTFGINMVALVNNQPRVLNLKKILRHFLNHRHDVVVNRTRFELRKAEERAHILEGLKIALDHLDEVIALIRASENPEAALSGLMDKFGLSKPQGQAILEMRLQRLTGLERGKIVNEHEEILKTIAELKDILASDERIYAIIRGELVEIRAKFADPRKTEITESEADISLEDLITEEQVVVTISQHGYIKRNSISEFRSQRRGGKGMIGMTTKEEDLVKMLFVCSTHDYMLFFTTRGRLFCEKVYQIPEGARATKGKAVVNLLMLEADELVSTFLNIREFAEGSYLTLITKNGVIKRTPLSDYKNVRARGIFAINLDEGDSLVAARITDGTKDIVVTTRDGLSARFPEAEARSIGRTARGVKAIELLNADEVVSADAVDADGTILTITEQGYGKRTPVSEHPVHHRGGKGVITIKTSERNGKVVRALQVGEDDEIMVIAHSGKMIRTRAADVSVMSRNTQGVRIMDLDDDDRVVSVDGFAEVEFAATSDDTVTDAGGVEDDA
ncbi:MAG: DNA gyrase subunit A [Nitrospirae bacterium]|nr:DNA gyrase subunit A [Nitrospirota bacterium]